MSDIGADISLTVTPTKVTIKIPGNIVVPPGDHTIKWKLAGAKFVASNPIDFAGNSPKKNKDGKAENPGRNSDTECSFAYNNPNPKNVFTRFKYTVRVERDGVVYEIDPEVTNEPPMG